MGRDVIVFVAVDPQEGFSAAELANLFASVAGTGFDMRVTPNLRGRVVRVEFTRGTGPGAR